MQVSIHAPAWGATDIRMVSIKELKGFNPRARVGRDPGSYVTERKPYWFQSTRPRGARRFYRFFLAYSHLFQSTRPRGARPEAGRLVQG